MQRVKQISVFGIRAKRNTPVAAARHIAQGKSDERFRHRQAFDDIADRLRFRSIRAHEFQPRRCRIKQVAQLDDRASAQGRGLHRRHLAARNGNGERTLPCNPRGDCQTPDRTEGRQCLAAKPECVDIQQIRAIDFRRRMAAHGQGQLRFRDAATIVRDADQCFAAISNRHLDPARTRINRVLDQFFHRGSRALYDFARRDPVDRAIVQLTNNR